MPRPARPWFRFYSETLENRKAQALGVDNPALFVHWINLMCLANVGKPRGFLPSITDIAFALNRMDVEAAERIVKELRRLKFVDRESSGRFRIHEWEEWQPDSDANLTPGRRTKPAKPAPNPRATPALSPHRVEVDKERDQEREAEPDKSGVPSGTVPLVRAFEHCFARLLSHTEIELIHALSEEHPRERIDYALREAAEANARNVRYVKAVCEGQERNNDQRDRGANSANGGPIATEQGDAWSIYRQSKPIFVLDVDDGGVDESKASGD